VEDENRPSDAQHQRRESIRNPQKDGPRPTVDVYLDPDELFSQLCTVPKLVQMGPKPGLFGSHVNVVDGLIRVWRDWLAAQASRQATIGGGAHDEPVLWADSDRDVGLRFRITEKDVRGEQDVLVARDDELPVAYRLEFEELLVRSSKLLEMVEKSEAREAQTEGKIRRSPSPFHDAIWPRMKNDPWVACPRREGHGGLQHALTSPWVEGFTDTRSTFRLQLFL
jgi:hypothetical protein